MVSKMMEDLVLFAPQIFFLPQRKKEVQRKMQRNDSKLKVDGFKVDGRHDLFCSANFFFTTKKKRSTKENAKE
jgi:hypothetical protein